MFISHHFQVIRTTGFMKGLYGENEMKSDNVKVSWPHRLNCSSSNLWPPRYSFTKRLLFYSCVSVLLCVKNIKCSSKQQSQFCMRSPHGAVWGCRCVGVTLHAAYVTQWVRGPGTTWLRGPAKVSELKSAVWEMTPESIMGRKMIGFDKCFCRNWIPHNSKLL